MPTSSERVGVVCDKCEWRGRRIRQDCDCTSCEYGTCLAHAVGRCPRCDGFLRITPGRCRERHPSVPTFRPSNEVHDADICSRRAGHSMRRDSRGGHDAPGHIHRWWDDDVKRCIPCNHGGDPPQHRGCQSNICPYDSDHHVHHGIGTRMFDPHPFQPSESISE